MKPYFLISALLCFGATGLQAQGTIIYPPFPPRPWPRPVTNSELQLMAQSASVEINGAVAKTRLVQTLQNTTNNRIEGHYVFPLPEGAAVSGFAMTVNGKRVQAEILNGDKAREIYNGIVAKMRDPGILEYVDRNLIRATIFPIEPRAEQKVELEYSESLKADSGSFRYVLPLRLPVGGAAQSASVDLKITSPLGIRAVYSPTHNVDVKRDGNTARISGEWGWKYPPNPQPVALRDDTPRQSTPGADRDFVLYYTADAARIGVNLVTHEVAGEDGYFMLLAAPDAAVAPKEIAAKDVVFVMDTSGSMAGEKIEQARRALTTLVGNLNPGDNFNIVTFSSEARPFRDAPVAASKANLDAARDWIKEIKAVGGTNINDALLEAFKQLPTSDRPQQVIFMTDGQPTVGETSIEQIIKNARGANVSNGVTERKGAVMATKARLFTFGVGFDVNTRLLDTLAEDNRGSSDYVLPQEDIEQKVGALYAKIAYPVLANPRLDFGGLKVYDVYPKRLPDLFKGTQVVVFGRYEGKPGGNAKIQLIGDNVGREERIAGQGNWTDKDGLNDTLPRLWATRKVGYLLDDARRSGRTVDPEVRDEIIKLSKKFGIVTPFTAGLITEDERQLPLGPATPLPGAAPGGFGGAVGPRGPQGDRAATGLGILHRSGVAPIINSPVPASGAEAVRAAKASKSLKEGDTLTENEAIRYVEGKAFFLRGDVWTDGAYDEKTSPKPVVVKFASPEYFALVKDKTIAKWLSVGEKAIIVLPGKVIKIEP